MTAHERSGWRDKELSQRHRRWGFNCPGVDLDFLMLEYNLAIPVAVVDYKHHKSTENDFNGPNFRALGDLYDRHGKQLPLLIARYWPDVWAFEVLPLNASAEVWLPQCDWVPMTERQFVSGLYKMRDLTIHEYVLRNLNDELPPDDSAAEAP